MKKILVPLCLVLLSNSVFGKLMLFSDDIYLGCLDCSSMYSDSICNSFGRYGNSFSSESIWNSFGQYGNSFSLKSPWNSFSSNGPKIVDDNGNFYGRFSINTMSGFSQSSGLNNLYVNLGGDLDKIRDVLCKDK